MIQRTEHTVAVPHLPESLRGLRVVQLSDLHRSHLTSDRLLHRAVEIANQAKPNLILLTGDYVTNETADIEPCAHILAPLRARLGVYAILGNHDYYVGARRVENALAEQGITVLVNRSARLEHGLYVVGLDDDRLGKPNLPCAFAGVHPGDPTLVMVHNPGFAAHLADRDCLVFAGHTHGGQILLPILTARQLRRIRAGRYRAGWYTVGKARMYVNRGVGRVGLPFRLFCPPEVAVFTLESRV